MGDIDKLAAALVAFQGEVPVIPKNRTANIPTKAGSSYCLAPETRVLTANLEWVSVGKVQAGDRIAAFDEHPTGVMKNRRKWRTAVVEAVGRESLPSCRITFADRTVITASEQHQWLTSHTDGTLHWRTTLNLARRGGHPVQVVRLTETWEADDSRDGGYIAGMYDGEGSLCQTPRQGKDAHQLILAMSQRENAALARVEAILTGDGYRLGQGRGGGSNGDVRQIILAGGRPEVLRFLGTYRPSRLLAALDLDRLGPVHALRRVSVESVEPVGQVEVVTLATSTKTLIAEGLASHNSYKFADLADMWEAIREPLRRNGLAVTQTLSGGSTGWTMIRTKVWHESGQEEHDYLEVPTGGRTPQEVGSLLTYYKRYALGAALGISTDDDDDGNGATQAPKRPAATPKSPAEMALENLRKLSESNNLDPRKLAARFKNDYGLDIKEADVQTIQGFIGIIADEAAVDEAAGR